MAAETVQSFEALERQAQTLMALFAARGHEAVAPAIIQPADVFLDVVGEALRARTYVFTDPDGAELCLRPDLTVPTCRLHLARAGDASVPARYCYNGPAFRFQPQGADAAHPREFRQAGIERFGDRDREAAEAETVMTVIKAVEAAGLRDWRITIGDLGLFRGVLTAAGVGGRIQQRLIDAFLRPGSFRASLKRLSRPRDGSVNALPATLVAALASDDLDAAMLAVAEHLAETQSDITGQRSLRDITVGLIEKFGADAQATLGTETAALLDVYATIEGPALSIGERITTLLADTLNGSAAALSIYDRRLAMLRNCGVDLSRVRFAAEFGRTLAYYTGFVFELSDNRSDVSGPIAGGGRYDGLMRAAGAAVDVPAVGAAIHTERLLAAVQGRPNSGGVAS